MALRVSIASGNFTDAATWGVGDATSYLNAENATESPLTTVYSATRSSAFTPGAITVSHIGVKLCDRNGTTGTMSVHLILSSDNSEVAGTEVTIDVADLPVAVAADLNGGWIFFKLASPVTLIAATAYKLEAKTSTAVQVDLFCDGTADNLSRILVTTTTGAPAAGDDMIVAGEYTGSGTSNTFTVTMNQTASTDYGAGSTSQVTPALAICSKGVLTWGTASSTNYMLKLSGHLIEYSGGVHNKGTTGTPCPRNSSMTLWFDCVTTLDFGHATRNGATFTEHGLSRTSGKNVVSCLLNTDEAAAQTVLGVDTDTGWLSGDEIGIASTTRTASQTERRTLSGNANTSDMTVTAGLTNAHSGTSPTQAEVILLTRNCQTIGTSTTVQTFWEIKQTANVDVSWASYSFMGSVTANRRGIDVQTTTGSAIFSYCSFYDFAVTRSGIAITGAAVNNFSMTNNVSYNCNVAISVDATTGTSWIVGPWIVMGSAGTIAASFSDVGGTITGITVAGCSVTTAAIQISQAGGVIGSITNLTSHSNSDNGTLFLGFEAGTITGVKSWRNNNTGMQISGLIDVMIDTVELFGNLTVNINLGASSKLVLRNLVSSSDSSFTTASGIAFLTSAGGPGVTIENSTFGVASGIKTAHIQDILCLSTGFTPINLYNTLLSSSVDVASQALLPEGVVVSAQKHNQTAGLHKSWRTYGTTSIDTTSGLFDVTPSVRMTPNNASKKLGSSSSVLFSTAVANGNTVTVSVKVRESVVGDGADYNGNRIRLLVKKNIAAGISADTVLATATGASEGAFETLSGTTVAVTDNAILEFTVDCDGTTGWINVDTWSVTSQESSLGMKFWAHGNPMAYGDNSLVADNFAKGVLIGQQLARAVG